MRSRRDWVNAFQQQPQVIQDKKGASLIGYAGGALVASSWLIGWLLESANAGLAALVIGLILLLISLFTS